MNHTSKVLTGFGRFRANPSHGEAVRKLRAIKPIRPYGFPRLDVPIPGTFNITWSDGSTGLKSWVVPHSMAISMEGYWTAGEVWNLQQWVNFTNKHDNHWLVFHGNPEGKQWIYHPNVRVFSSGDHSFDQFSENAWNVLNEFFSDIQTGRWFRWK